MFYEREIKLKFLYKKKKKKKENMDACFLFTLLVCDRYCDHAQYNRNVESMFVS